MPLCAAWVFVQSGHCLLQLGSHALLAPPRCHHHPPLFPHHTPAPAHIVAAHHPSSSILIADHLVAARLPAALPPATPLNITPAQPTHMLKDRLAMLLQVPPRSDSFNLNAQTLGLYLESARKSSKIAALLVYDEACPFSSELMPHFVLFRASYPEIFVCRLERTHASDRCVAADTFLFRLLLSTSLHLSFSFFVHLSLLRSALVRDCAGGLRCRLLHSLSVHAFPTVVFFKGDTFWHRLVGIRALSELHAFVGAKTDVEPAGWQTPLTSKELSVEDMAQRFRIALIQILEHNGGPLDVEEQLAVYADVVEVERCMAKLGARRSGLSFLTAPDTTLYLSLAFLLYYLTRIILLRRPL
eukprot:m.252027 g.252027  ORF g.252027 m.252027 type:complete len:357 (-) comp54516_c0_seq2:5544-6614(-)